MNGALGGSTPYGYPLNARSKALQAAMDDVIRSLFRNGEKGVWFDPSDLSTMYQDSAGTTPVTALGQPVGLMLDKSKGLALGPELMTNGNFDGGITGWTANAGANLSNPSGRLRVDTKGNGTEGIANSAVALTVGRTYVIEFDLIGANNTGSITAGGVRIILPGPSMNSGRKKVYLTATTNQPLSFATNTPIVGFYIEVDNVSVREIAGNHATQATAGSRPTLEARVNLLTKSEAIGASPWATSQGGTGSAPTVTQNAGTAPDGTNTASRLQLNLGGGTTSSDFTRIYQQAGAVVANTVAFMASVWLKSNDSNTYQVSLNVTANGDRATVSVGPTWTRVKLSAAQLLSTTAVEFRLELRGSHSTSNTADILAWGAQIEYCAVGTTQPTTYQKVNTATDYTDIGAPRYLNFDGTDDFLVMPSIDFTGTSVLTSFAAVRKHSIDNGCVWASSTADTGGAGMMMGYINGARAGYWVSNGTNNGARALSSNYSLNPEVHSAVLTLGVAAASQVAARVNGSAASNASNPDAGSGNFQNLPIYIGRRNGSTLPLNGRIYGLVIRGASTPTATMDRVDRVFGKKAQVSW